MLQSTRMEAGNGVIAGVKKFVVIYISTLLVCALALVLSALALVFHVFIAIYEYRKERYKSTDTNTIYLTRKMIDDFS